MGVNGGYLKGRIKGGKLVKEKEFINEMTEITGHDYETCERDYNAFQELVLQHIAMEDHMHFSFGIVGGETKPPQKLNGRYSEFWNVQEETRRNYSYAKSGYPFIVWSDDAIWGNATHPAIFYLEWVPMKYTTDAYWFRKELGYPEIPEYAGMPDEKILQLCEKADIIVYGELTEQEKKDRKLAQKNKERLKEYKRAKALMIDLDKQRENGVAEEDLVFRDPDELIFEQEKEWRSKFDPLGFVSNKRGNMDAKKLKEIREKGFYTTDMSEADIKILEETYAKLRRLQEAQRAKNAEIGKVDNDVDSLRTLLHAQKKIEKENEGKAIELRPEYILEKYNSINRKLNSIARMTGKEFDGEVDNRVQLERLRAELDRSLGTASNRLNYIMKLREKRKDYYEERAKFIEEYKKAHAPPPKRGRPKKHKDPDTRDRIITSVGVVIPYDQRDLSAINAWNDLMKERREAEKQRLKEEKAKKKTKSERDYLIKLWKQISQELLAEYGMYERYSNQAFWRIVNKRKRDYDDWQRGKKRVKLGMRRCIDDVYRAKEKWKKNRLVAGASYGEVKESAYEGESYACSLEEYPEYIEAKKKAYEYKMNIPEMMREVNHGFIRKGPRTNPYKITKEEVYEEAKKFKDAAYQLRLDAEKKAKKKEEKRNKDSMRRNGRPAIKRAKKARKPKESSLKERREEAQKELERQEEKKQKYGKRKSNNQQVKEDNKEDNK